MSSAPDDPLSFEKAAWHRGALLIGVDEVGRGPLAGPVLAAAVALNAGQVPIVGVRDSKRVKSALHRERLSGEISAVAIIGLGAASVGEIEKLNIRVATALAMRRAIARCRKRLKAATTWNNTRVELVVDGLPVPELDEHHLALVGGDARCHSVAAASLVAKHTRDLLMRRLAARRPGYAWEANAGYGTTAHFNALRELGLTPHHRPGFCRSIVSQTTLFHP